MSKLKHKKPAVVLSSFVLLSFFAVFSIVPSVCATTSPTPTHTSTPSLLSSGLIDPLGVYTSCDPGSWVSPSGFTSEIKGSSQTVTYDANAGYYISNVIVSNNNGQSAQYISDGGSENLPQLSNDAKLNYTFTNMTESCILNVESASTSGGSSIVSGNDYPDSGITYSNVQEVLYQTTGMDTNCSVSYKLNSSALIPLTLRGGFNMLVNGDSENRTWYTFSAMLNLNSANASQCGTYTIQFYWTALVWEPNNGSPYWATFSGYSSPHTFSIEPSGIAGGNGVYVDAQSSSSGSPTPTPTTNSGSSSGSSGSKYNTPTSSPAAATPTPSPRSATNWFENTVRTNIMLDLFIILLVLAVAAIFVYTYRRPHSRR